MIDLDEHGKEYVICKGGEGGKGNGLDRSVKAFETTGKNSIKIKN